MHVAEVDFSAACQSLSDQFRSFAANQTVISFPSSWQRWIFAAERHHLGLVERQLIAQRFGAPHCAKAATEDDDAFGAHL